MVVLLQKAKAIKRESGEIPEQYPNSKRTGEDSAQKKKVEKNKQQGTETYTKKNSYLP
jgi:hypothetical protein